jgi:hypothetical protein
MDSTFKNANVEHKAREKSIPTSNLGIQRFVYVVRKG